MANNVHRSLTDFVRPGVRSCVRLPSYKSRLELQKLSFRIVRPACKRALVTSRIFSKIVQGLSLFGLSPQTISFLNFLLLSKDVLKFL